MQAGEAIFTGTNEMNNGRLELYNEEPLVRQNAFIGGEAREVELPDYAALLRAAPRPYWAGHDDALACYDKVWQIAARNLRNPHPGSGFVSPFIDTAFNGFLFMWDSCFILLFARYGVRGFDFQQTLDNLYSHQHKDGFISREIHEINGVERFHRFDPSTTGPNILAWCEWEHYCNFADEARLRRVFPALLAFHRWMRLYRSWPDGSYWFNGLSCGMDNMPRCPEGYHHMLHHGFMGWIDATAQAALSAQCIMKIAAVLGADALAQTADLKEEYERIDAYVNAHMWNEEAGIYADRFCDGRVSNVVHVGAYWAVLAGIARPDRTARMLALLDDPLQFNRPHRVPSLSFSHPEYDALGEYWKGSIWAPTNYMILRGLRSLHSAEGDRLARAIGRNHHAKVVDVFNQTQTVWENYAPESAAKGSIAKPDFVGWSGLGPVAVLLEEVFGLQPDVPAGRLVWDVSLCEEFGVERYPFGVRGLYDLRCKARADAAAEPVVEITGNAPLRVELRWTGGSRVIDYRP